MDIADVDQYTAVGSGGRLVELTFEGESAARHDQKRCIQLCPFDTTGKQEDLCRISSADGGIFDMWAADG